VTTQVSGNANQYRFQAQYTQSAQSGETLYLTVSQLQSATNHVNASADNCTAVNQADWLQSVYVYNASAWKQHDTLWVSVSYNSDIDDFQTIGTAVYDKATDRIVYDGSALGNTVCLPNVFRIAIRNLTPVTPPTQERAL
jgi:hypothetical protein